ncbi:MAG: hypothetical protein ABH863_03510 [Candidatus Micrarchaeota archaeon]
MVVVEPYITKKVARRTAPKIVRYKARLMERNGKDVTDVEAIDSAMDIALELDLPKIPIRKGERKYTMEDLIGIAGKGKMGKFNAQKELEKMGFD